MTVWTDFGPNTYIESKFERDLWTASKNRNNYYNEENLFHGSFGHLTVVSKHIWKIEPIL